MTAPTRAATTDLVLTLIGPDRPGLVEAVAQAIATQGGNWVESRMAQLAGKFAGVLRVELPSGAVDQLRAALAALETRGLKIVLESAEKTPPPQPQQAMELELLGLDRPGLVREVSRLLAAAHINVEELVTDRSSAPMSGEMMFRARARLAVPPGADLQAVRASLERLAGDLMVEIRLAPSG